MKLGKFKLLSYFVLIFLLNTITLTADDKIETVPLVNLEELSPTFEEDKDELEKIDVKSDILRKDENISKLSKK